MDKKGDGNIQLLGVGEEEIRSEMGQRLNKIYLCLTDEEADTGTVSDALYDLKAAVKEIRKKNPAK